MNALTYDPTSDLQHWPLPMARFGQNPYGENLYRIVFAPSRRYLVSGVWPDGSVCARWAPKYRVVGDQWVMEKWLPAERYAGVSRAVWDVHMSELGPWPERGEYELCHVFEACTPTDANIEKLIQWVEMGGNHTLAEKTAFAREQWEKERAGTRNTAQDLIRNRLPAFGAAAFVSSRVARGTKLFNPFQHSAQELGLPTHGGQTRTKQGRKYDVALEIGPSRAA